MELKINYTKKPFETYVSFDPAIDQEASDMKQYLLTRDTSFLKFKPGMTPTKFYLRNIPRGIVTKGIIPQENEEVKFMFAFQYGVQRIDNLKETFLNEGVEINNNGLTAWEPSKILTLANSNSFRYIDEDECNEFFNWQTVREIGSIALKKTLSIPGVKQDFPVLLTSIEIIERMKS
jgi:hypothetical protein